MKINFKVIIIYIFVTILLPVLASTYLSIKSENYFYNYNIIGIKQIFINKINLYNKVTSYMGQSPQSDDVAEMLNIIRKSVRSLPNYETTILSEGYDHVILRGKKIELVNLNFEKYKEKIEESVRNYIYQERELVSEIIIKLEKLREINFEAFKKRIVQYEIDDEREIKINVIFNLENLKDMNFETFKERVTEYEKSEETHSNINYLNKKILMEMSQINTTLERQILYPKVRLDSINDIIKELNDSKYFFNYQDLGGKDKTINIILDHFIKFFILANICLLLFIPNLYKRAHKLLSVKY